MSEYSLTADEVLYLAAMNGAEYFYGVPDYLSGLSDRDLKMRVMEIEDSLNQKGYMQTDFDGNNKIDGKLLQMIDACAGNEGFLCLESKVLGEPQAGCLYFIKGGAVYSMTPDKDIYAFQKLSLELLEQTVKERIVWKETERGETGCFSILNRDLEKASTLAGRGASNQAKELLRDAGAAESMADVVLAGLKNQADFYSLFFLNGKEEGTGFGIQFLQGKLLIGMRNDTQKDEDCIEFYVSNRSEQEALIAEGFRKLGFAKI